MWKLIQGRVVYNTPLGWILPHFRGKSLTRLSFPEQDLETALGSFPQGSLPQREIELLARWLEAYFSQREEKLNLQLEPEGTAFAQGVWQATKKIPFGQTRSYSWVAQSIGRPKAVRAVGGALKRNPLPLVIPCHRVIYAQGGIGGYGGNLEKLLRIKEKLLSWEVSP